MPEGSKYIGWSSLPQGSGQRADGITGSIVIGFDRFLKGMHHRPSFRPFPQVVEKHVILLTKAELFEYLNPVTDG